MQKFWSRLAVLLGKHAGIVSLAGLVITLGLGFGIAELEFATGTDSYLNADEPVYKDSIRYQDRLAVRRRSRCHHHGRGPHRRRAGVRPGQPKGAPGRGAKLARCRALAT